MLSFVSRSLRLKIIAWSFIPTSIILLAVALMTFYAYQQVTEDLVIGRNQEVTRLSAGQLGANLSQYSDVLTGLARTADIYRGEPALQQAALGKAKNELVVYDAGVLVINRYGVVVAAEPSRPDALGQNWADRVYYNKMLRSGSTVFSDVVADGPEGSNVVVVAVPITDDKNEFQGTLTGMFHLGATAVSTFYGGIVKLRMAVSGATYIVDGTGRVIYHSDADQIGQDYSNRSVVQRLLSRRMTETSARGLDGPDILASFAPVPGTSWSLVTEEQWSTLMSASQGYRNFLLILLALGVVVPAVVVTLGVRRITGPIGELISASQEVAGGKFGRTIDVRTGDELEKLANQFNAMSAELQESYSDLERKVADRTKELATLNAISIVVSRSLNLCEALRDALSKTLQLSGLERGGIYLLNERDGVLSLEVHQGISPDVAADVGSLRLGEGFSGQVAASGEPLVVSDVSSDPRISKIAFAEGVGGSLACVPLSSRGCVLGALFVVSGGHREFTPQDVQILSSIGHQIGVAVENARLYQQAQQLAVVEERNRLARDLHDSVTQAMYSVTLYAEAATRLLSAGQIVSAAEHLRDLRATAQQALREMRSLIFELRPSVLAKEGLVAALQARLESVEGRAGIRTDFQVEGSAQVPAEIESGLYGIAQEALNNVLKHSGAQALRLYLRKDEGVVALEVVDDGTGFELNHGSECGGLGLRGMEERAAVMGGRLIVSSAPGQGTSVRVEVNL